ncbi:MAG: hypothetical protein BIFFINMI_03845 [Phycisphaerae bacterium]|nr:hypothetical protein [Phycisphaerae bacterium]
MSHKTLLTIAAVAVISLSACEAASADVYRLDMGPFGVESGWVQVTGNNRFDVALNNSSTTADLGGGARAGYNGWLKSNQPSAARPVTGTWPAGYGTSLQEDFSGPISGYKLIIWNLPAGDYQVTLYMRDWQYSSPSTYNALAHDDTLFTVVRADMVVGDLASISDTHTLSTVLFDPDGASGNYDAQPSIWFTYTTTNSSIMAIEIASVTAVPEPATLGLLCLGGLGLIGRRIRRRRGA